MLFWAVMSMMNAGIVHRCPSDISHVLFRLLLHHLIDKDYVPLLILSATQSHPLSPSFDSCFSVTSVNKSNVNGAYVMPESGVECVQGWAEVARSPVSWRQVDVSCTCCSSTAHLHPTLPLLWKLWGTCPDRSARSAAAGLPPHSHAP